MKTNELEQMITRLKDEVMRTFPLQKLSDDELYEKIEDLVENQLAGEYVPISQRVLIVEQVYSSIRGFGLLDTILGDDNITEVMINGPDNIFIEGSNKRKEENMWDSINYLYCRMMIALREFKEEQKGAVDLVVIVVLIGIGLAMAVLFRKQIGGILTKLFSDIGKKADEAIAPMGG